MNGSLPRPSLEPSRERKRNPDFLMGTPSTSGRSGHEQKRRERRLHLYPMRSASEAAQQRELPKPLPVLSLLTARRHRPGRPEVRLSRADGTDRTALPIGQGIPAGPPVPSLWAQKRQPNCGEYGAAGRFRAAEPIVARRPGIVPGRPVLSTDPEFSSSLSSPPHHLRREHLESVPLRPESPRCHECYPRRCRRASPCRGWRLQLPSGYWSRSSHPC